MEAIDPRTGEVVGIYPEMESAEVIQAIERAERAFHHWKRVSFEERAGRMAAAAAILRRRAEDFSIQMAREMGKPIREGRAEAEKCAWVCEYYAENAEAFLRNEPVKTDATSSSVVFRPLGAILAVMPWNFPFWQVFRFAAPALMAGNVGLLKHASNVPGCAQSIERVFLEAGFPPAVFQNLRIGSSKVKEIIEHQSVKAVTLTGSTPAGRAVASQAGRVLKKSVLELGGSDPYLILADADIEESARICAAGRLLNSGQSCIAAKRFVVVREVRNKFEELLVLAMSRAVMGDPLEEATTLGPQAREDLRDVLHSQVQQSLERGARSLLGGKIPEGPGAYYPATVLTDVAKGMPAYEEELFGPVAAIIPVEDEEEAIRVANDSSFGLGAAVFTRDVKRGERIAAEELEAGSCFVNAFVKSDPRLPFGGVKESGYGRELSHYGIREFVNIKTVWVR